MYAETKIAQMKMDKARKYKDEFKVYDDKGGVFEDYIPEFHYSEEVKNDTSLHPELRKMIYSNFSEGPDYRFNLENEEDGVQYEIMRDTAINYYNAKKQYLDDAFEN